MGDKTYGKEKSSSVIQKPLNCSYSAHCIVKKLAGTSQWKRKISEFQCGTKKTDILSGNVRTDLPRSCQRLLSQQQLSK
jgi:hypothetical protein